MWTCAHTCSTCVNVPVLAHSPLHDLHKVERAALPHVGSSSQPSLCMRDTCRAGHDAGPRPEEIPLGQKAAGDAGEGGWATHVGKHVVTGVAPFATREGLDPSLGSRADGLH